MRTFSPIPGMACRGLVLGWTVFGLAWFVCDALLITTAYPDGTVSVWALAGMAAVATAVFAAMALSRAACAIGLGAMALGALIAWRKVPYPVWRATVRHVLDVTFTRLRGNGFDVPEHIEIPADAVDPALCFYLASGTLILVLTAVFVPCLIRRTHIVPPAVVGLAIPVAVFICELNRSTWSFAFLLAGYTAILTLAAYDRRHLCGRRGVTADPARTRTHIAAGGLAGAGSLAVAMLILAVPTACIKTPFPEIDFIGSSIEQISLGIQALSSGEDGFFDLRAYGSDPDSSKPHSIAAEKRSFTGQKIFEVETVYPANIYLCGWIGTDYRDGSWYPADEAALAAYRETFGTGFSPEQLRVNFYRSVDPDVLLYTDYLSRYQDHTERGFVTLQVNLRRLTGDAALVYMPAYFNPEIGIVEHTSSKPSELSYLNYFDGLYTGQGYAPGAAYGAVAYVTTMRDDTFMDTVSSEIAAYNVANRIMRRWLLLGRQDDMKMGETEGFTVEFAIDHLIECEITYSIGGYHASLSSYLLSSGSDRAGSGGARKVESQWLDADVRTLTIEILNRYLNMTTLELNELQTAWTTEETYRRHVYATYTDAADSNIIRRETIRAVEHKLQTQLLRDGSDPAYDPAAYQNRHAAVMAVIGYLAEEIEVTDENGQTTTVPKFTYTLEPSKPLDDALDGVENFLAVTAEGYCVQFASAAVLMLRELGIPARYVEGYIVTDFAENTRSSQPYRAEVLDRNAHAWIEVYYDGIGWLNYEATAVYREELYPASDPDEPGLPLLPTEPTAPEQTPEAPDPPAPKEAETDNTPADVPDAEDAYPLVPLLIAVAVIVTAIVLVLLLWAAARRADRARRRRDAAVCRGFAPGSPKARAVARQLIDEVTALLAACGAAPAPGELHRAYAARLTPDYGRLCPIPLTALFAAIAAEEFGGARGMDADALRALAAFRRSLGRTASKRMPLGRRLIFRYVKHLF